MDISKLKKPTGARGEEHGMTKLTEDDVHHIVHLTKEGYTQASIAEAFGVVPASICNIVKGRTWSWLTGIK